jgi:hypothetical protein
VPVKKDNKEDVAWIPEKFAIEGKILKINGDSGWIVSAAYNSLDIDAINSNLPARRHMKSVIGE